jgi:hypothetical protein
MLIIGAGLVAGCLHVVSGPDHLVALAPIAVESRTRSIRIGATWGLGHGLGVCALGGIGIVAKKTLDIGVISAWSEFLVGVVLVTVGLWAIRRALSITIHAHGHNHAVDQVQDHHHFHVHTDEPHGEQAHRNHGHTAFGVGMLHGAAGTGHLFGVVPALALPPADAAVYILAYLGAAVLSMAAFGGLVGTVLARGGQRRLRTMMMYSGGMAIAVGLFWSWNSWPL